MKIFPKISLFLLAFFLYQNATAQNNLPNPCTAICLDPVLNPTQVRTPQKVRGIAVCNMTPLDTSSWWTFRPVGTTFNFSWATTGCTCATGGIAGADVVVYKGTSCSALTKIQCKNGVAGSFALTNLSPCNQYWIQVGSTNTCQCNVTLSYNMNQLLKTIEPVKITGPKIVCKGTTATYSATSPNNPCLNTNVFRWVLAQGTADYSTSFSSSFNLTFTKGGKARVTVEPQFPTCSPTFTKAYFDVEVIDLKEASENLKICPEYNGYYVDLKTIIRKTNPGFDKEITPATYEVNEPPGTKKTIIVPYTVVGTNCTQIVKLNIDIPSIKKVTLPSRLIAEGEKLTIKGQTFSCADVRATPLTVIKDGIENATCDSLFSLSLQCIKVNPTIFPKAALLDCVHKTIFLDASKSTTLPAALSSGKGNTGTRTYLWSNGATTPKISVGQAGTYSVTVSYTYKWLSPTGTLTRTVSKSSSAVVLGSINNKPVTPLPSTEQPVPCIGDTTLYYQPHIDDADYTWAATNGTIIGANKADSVRVVWGDKSPKKLCNRLTAKCGIGNDTCMTIQTSTVVPATPKLVLNLCIVPNTFRFAVASQPDVTHHWTVTNGTLSKSIGDTVMISWANVGARSFCITAVADCTVSTDTCVTHGSSLKENPNIFKTAATNATSVFEMKVLPNPARENIEIWSNRKISSYLIFDLTGRLLLETTESLIDISNFEKGVYLIKGIDDTKEVKILNFMKI